jgi:enterochelin esterase-like enzyme
MPITISNNHVTFTAPAGAAALAGDWTLVGSGTEAWQRNAIPLKAGDSLRLEFPAGAFIEYAFLDGDHKPLADPDNPRTTGNPWFQFPRAAVLPGYQPDQWRDGLAEAAKGNITRLNWMGQALPGIRRAIVWTPPAYNPVLVYPVFYVQDGIAFYRSGKMATVCEALLHLGQIEPAILVFLEPNERNSEYFLNDRYADFLISEVLPKIEADFAVAQTPDRRGLWGASLGGLISFYSAFEHSDVFGRVVVHSGAFQAEYGAAPRSYGQREWLLEHIATQERRNLRIWLDCGQLEWLLAANRRMAAALFEQKYTHHYREWPSGHNWETWRNAIPAALRFMLGI